MKIKDETTTLPFNVSKEDLDKIAMKTGAAIHVESDVIIIEGDQAEVDEAAGMIANLKKNEPEDVDAYENPYDSIQAGQRYSDKRSKGALPDEYSVYDLLYLDKDTGKWHCQKTTYHFAHHPYRHVHTSRGNAELTDEQLSRMDKTNRRK